MDMTKPMSPAEARAIQNHQKAMEQQLLRDVSREEAENDWFEHHAVAWREARQARFLTRQREEMLRHKWIESEKAHRDLGREAVLDWISKYAAAWREAFEHDGSDDDVSSRPGGSLSTS